MTDKMLNQIVFKIYFKFKLFCFVSTCGILTYGRSFFLLKRENTVLEKPPIFSGRLANLYTRRFNINRSGPSYATFFCRINECKAIRRDNSMPEMISIN